MKTLGGVIVFHDCIRLDYCWRQALHCLIETCDKVIVVDGDSKDGTLQAVEQDYGKFVQIIRTKWAPTPGGTWLADLYNIGRNALRTRMYFALQADEVVHPDNFNIVRMYAADERPIRFNRINFWGDTRTVAPHGTVCGHKVLRLHLLSAPVVGDAEQIEHSGKILESDINIFHYGFLRHNQAFLEKSKEMLPYFCGMDARLARADREGIPWVDLCGFEEAMLSYDGPHPEFMREWLQERGQTI